MKNMSRYNEYNNIEARFHFCDLTLERRRSIYEAENASSDAQKIPTF